MHPQSHSQRKRNQHDECPQFYGSPKNINQTTKLENFQSFLPQSYLLKDQVCWNSNKVQPYFTQEFNPVSVDVSQTETQFLHRHRLVLRKITQQYTSEGLMQIEKESLGQTMQSLEHCQRLSEVQKVNLSAWIKFFPDWLRIINVVHSEIPFSFKNDINVIIYEVLNLYIEKQKTQFITANKIEAIVSQNIQNIIKSLYPRLNEIGLGYPLQNIWPRLINYLTPFTYTVMMAAKGFFINKYIQVLEIDENLQNVNEFSNLNVKVNMGSIKKKKNIIVKRRQAIRRHKSQQSSDSKKRLKYE